MLAASVFTLVALEPNHGAGHLAIIAKGKTYHGIAAQLPRLVPQRTNRRIGGSHLGLTA